MSVRQLDVVDGLVRVVRGCDAHELVAQTVDDVILKAEPPEQLSLEADNVPATAVLSVAPCRGADEIGADVVAGLAQLHLTAIKAAECCTALKLWVHVKG